MGVAHRYVCNIYFMATTYAGTTSACWWILFQTPASRRKMWVTRSSSDLETDRSDSSSVIPRNLPVSPARRARALERLDYHLEQTPPGGHRHSLTPREYRGQRW